MLGIGLERFCRAGLRPELVELALPVIDLVVGADMTVEAGEAVDQSFDIRPHAVQADLAADDPVFLRPDCYRQYGLHNALLSAHKCSRIVEWRMSFSENRLLPCIECRAGFSGTRASG